jgi:hypothetical protein
MSKRELGADCMHPPARDCLRTTIRRIVHRACWRRHDGDEAGAVATRDAELDAFLNTLDGPTLPSTTLQNWIEQDEAEFEHAILISDLVARRMSRAAGDLGPPIPDSLRLVPSPRMEDPVPPRPRREHVPAVADLLDEMLSQQARPARAVSH